MRILGPLSVVATALAVITAAAQQPAQPQLKIDSSNRTLTVTAEDTVSVEPEVAVLHIGFQTPPGDAKSVYAQGTQTSNTIISALKQAGVPENDIRSESQYLDRDYSTKQNKYKLTQQWTVRTTPQRAAEILDTAINAGATSSGEIEWTVKDETALAEQALNRAADRARANAAVLAKGMGVRLGTLIYVSNQISGAIVPRPMAMATLRAAETNAQPLAIEPHKVTRQASVYAIFAIE